MSEPLLDVEGLVTAFPARGGAVPVVDRVDLAVSPGEVLALVGESGCGKSMTALSILRLVPKPGRIAAGRVRFAGRREFGLEPIAIETAEGRHRYELEQRRLSAAAQPLRQRLIRSLEDLLPSVPD